MARPKKSETIKKDKKKKSTKKKDEVVDEIEEVEEVVEKKSKTSKGKKSTASKKKESIPESSEDDLSDIDIDDSSDENISEGGENDEVIAPARPPKKEYKKTDPSIPIGDLTIEDILNYLVQKGIDGMNPQLKHGAINLRNDLNDKGRRHNFRKNNFSGRGGSFSRDRGNNFNRGNQGPSGLGPDARSFQSNGPHSGSNRGIQGPSGPQRGYNRGKFQNKNEGKDRTPIFQDIDAYDE